ncbi:MAG: hypothetical protein M3281_08230 [Chloroflexota bacterium]|nr:hypothetical protein [Chloroflexota bacterium]
MSRNGEDIIIVGVCAAGKSTLAERLRASGRRARTVAQEHSCIPDLWCRTGAPHTVYLHASFEAVKRRRDSLMHVSNYQAQLHRLRLARQHASVRVDTSDLTPEEVYEMVNSLLRSQEDERGAVRPTDREDPTEPQRRATDEPMPVPDEPGDRSSSRTYKDLPIPDEL